MAASGEVDLEHQLADAFGLDLCQVVTDLHQDELPLKALGVAGSKFLADEIEHEQKMLIGVSHGRTLLACVENLARARRRTSASSSLMGGLTRSAPRQPARGRQPPGRAHRRRGHCHAGAVHGQHRGDRDVLLGQQDVAEAYELARHCDLMLVGIGTTSHEAELVTTGMIEPAEMAAIARAGGVGEMLGHFFDEPGRPVENELTAAHRDPAARRPAEPAHRRRSPAAR